ncbi:DUF429 domain-containing protein [Halolamina sp. C58]|uniref:DUF429 domain-containing protein n=1 Tax=Halolamina sp. C58 TaxID=3421640 RepID=UPI003EBF6771
MAYTPPETVFGVDFSGATDAGTKIWIAEIDASGEPELIDCAPATERFGVDADRADAHRALTHHLAGLDGDTAAALDFPFALPASVVDAGSWTAFVRTFPSLFASPADLQRRCQSRAELADGDRVQHVRATEESVGALSPYNRRLRSQTFYGIRDVLRPLVLADTVRAVPMQDLDAERPTLLETYPAAALDSLDGETHRAGYKEASDEGRERREANLDALAAESEVTVAAGVRQRLLDDDGGDGLDAALAAFAGWRNTVDPTNLAVEDGEYGVEGYIYV